MSITVEEIKKELIEEFRKSSEIKAPTLENHNDCRINFLLYQLAKAMYEIELLKEHIAAKK